MPKNIIVSCIFGTRPEAIKLAPVILELKNHSNVVCRVCVTGQHREMLDQVLAVFRIVPDVDLDIMVPNQTLAKLSSRAIEAVDRYLDEDKPALVLVQGDTTTVFCATLASFYKSVPVAHIEAGLRTWNLSAPWPEEANRVLVSRLALHHFAPTDSAKDNLLVEGIPAKAITVTGNTVIDALFLTLEKIKGKPPRIKGLPDFLQPSTNVQNGVPRVVLITGHRRENFGEGFEEICIAIEKLARGFPDVHFVYPVHLNPNVREPVMRILQNPNINRRSNIHLIEPLAYLPFIAMMCRSKLILTDSGGVQEEAPSLGKPVLVMRENTERPEAVRAGTARLVGTKRDGIFNEVSRLLTDETAYNEMARAHNPYGDGNAGEKIVERVRRFLMAGSFDYRL